MKRAYAVALSLLAGSCVAAPRAEVLVTVDAEPGVREAAHSVAIHMWGRATDGQFDDANPQTETGTRFPWTVALRPQGQDDNRIFRFEATAYTGTESQPGNFVSQARLISGYQPGQILHVYLLLQDSCIGVPCDQLSDTCKNGSCETIPPMPTLFDPDAGFPDAAPPLGDCTPGAPETCDHRDNDCDRVVDEGIEFDSDVHHCGSCENDCVRSNATPSCMSGVCGFTCDANWADCNMAPSDGCETNVLDPMHCGSCTNVCPAGMSSCEDSGSGPHCVSACSGGRTNCSGMCVDLSASAQNCGSCGNACPMRANATPTCMSSHCVLACQSGFRNCNNVASDGCEAEIANDPSNCGFCGNICPPPDPGCGIATCAANSCGVSAMSGATCSAGGCVGSCDGTGTCVPFGICDAGVPDAGRDADAGDADAGDADAGDAGLCPRGCAGTVCCNGTCCGPGEICDTSGGFPICSAPPPPDAGGDAGSCSPACTAGQVCCAGFCYGSATGTCCEGMTYWCSSASLMVCDASDLCVPSSPPDAGGEGGTDVCGGCGPSEVCCDAGVTTQCCSPGDSCVYGSGCEPPGPACTMCTSSVCCPSMDDASAPVCCFSGTCSGFGFCS